MKKIWLVLIAAGLAVAQNPAARPKPSVQFDGKTFVLKFVDQTRAVDLNEYYLLNEQPENWTHLVSVSLYKTPLTPAAMARNMEQGLLAKHPDAPHELIARPDGVTVFLCMNWAGDRQTGSEFSVYRLQKHARGVLAYQASLRPYQAKVSREQFDALRNRWTRSIQAGQWPDVTLQRP